MEHARNLLPAFASDRQQHKLGRIHACMLALDQHPLWMFFKYFFKLQKTDNSWLQIKWIPNALYSPPLRAFMSVGTAGPRIQCCSSSWHRPSPSPSPLTGFMRHGETRSAATAASTNDDRPEMGESKQRKERKVWRRYSSRGSSSPAPNGLDGGKDRGETGTRGRKRWTRDTCC